MSSEYCRVVGCQRKKYCEGMCHQHYYRYHAGITDKDGKILRSFKNLFPVNVAIRGTLRLIKKAEENAQQIKTEIKKGDKNLKLRVNKRLYEINSKAAKQKARLTESGFVLGNIHLMHPMTLQMILGNAPAKPKEKLTFSDKARIAWHLLRGSRPKEIAEMFSIYDIKQIEFVKSLLLNGKLPVNKIEVRQI